MVYKKLSVSYEDQLQIPSLYYHYFIYILPPYFINYPIYSASNEISIRFPKSELVVVLSL